MFPWRDDAPGDPALDAMGQASEVQLAAMYSKPVFNRCAEVSLFVTG